MKGWYVYMLRCVDDSLYTGITRDLTRRIAEHNGDDRRGAAYTRARRPVRLVYREHQPTRAAALRREAQIKRLHRSAKLQLLQSGV